MVLPPSCPVCLRLLRLRRETPVIVHPEGLVLEELTSRGITVAEIRMAVLAGAVRCVDPSDLRHAVRFVRDDGRRTELRFRMHVFADAKPVRIFLLLPRSSALRRARTLP